MAPMAPARAPRGKGLRPRKLPPTPSMTRSATPKAAPVETPRVKGSARGFRRSPWKMTPAVAREAPTSPESTTRERRIPQMTTSVVRSTAPG